MMMMMMMIETTIFTYLDGKQLTSKEHLEQERQRYKSSSKRSFASIAVHFGWSKLPDTNQPRCPYQIMAEIVYIYIYIYM